ncbi:riboflavin synthase [Staphylococcus haemolyticus]|nr:riboflavin synthase [Staphylococcus haemolyticus]
MFTGIVEEIGTVKNIRTHQSVRTLDIACQTITEDMHIGDSISVNGACFVLGHVDDKGVITQVKETPNSRIVSIRASSTIINQMVKQGSITVDGVSLTIFDLRHDSFDIHLIPETRRSTILSSKQNGDQVHLETDVLFKYVERMVSRNESELTLDKLKAFGF